MYIHDVIQLVMLYKGTREGGVGRARIGDHIIKAGSRHLIRCQWSSWGEPFFCIATRNEPNPRKLDNTLG